MSSGRTVGIVVLAILLTVTLGVGNAVFAAHSTVLSPDFATNALAEEDGYEVLTQEMERAIENATDGTVDGGFANGSFSSIIEGEPIQDAVTPAYVESQIEPNVREFYTYLHGNSDRLNLTLDTSTLAERVGENVAASIRNATMAELIEAAPGDPLAGVPVNESFLADLNDGPEEYRAAKEGLHDRVIEEMIDEAFAEASNDELLALVIPDYDPRDYSAAEKERMVEDREAEIRDALRSRIADRHGGDVDAAVEDRLDQYRAGAGDLTPTAEQVGSQAIANATGDLQGAVLTAVTTDQSYEAYRANVTDARSDLASAVGNYVTARITEETGVVDLNEQFNVQETGEFEDARTLVGYLDLSAILLPILALLLVGGVWFLSRSVATTAAAVGASLVVAAIPAIVGAPMAGSRLRAAIDGGVAASLEPVIEGIVGRVVATVTGQSLLVAVVGLALIALALSLRYGLDERLRAAWAAR